MLERIRQAVLRYGRTTKGAKRGSQTQDRIDRVVRRLTGGRIRATTQFLFPTLVLRSVGRRSGLVREHPLAFIEDGDGVPVVVGTNFGQESTPAWAHNLMADPEADIDRGSGAEPVAARLLTPDEMAQRWSEFDRVYPGFEDYRSRIGDSRPIRMFRLESR